MLKFELNVHYSTDFSQIYFNDFKNENNVILDSHHCIIFNNGSKNEPYFKKSRLAKMKKEQLQELAENLSVIYCTEDLTKTELIEKLFFLDNESFYQKALENDCLPSCDFSIHGYSQGDFVKVYQVGGSEYSKEYLTNLFFDCPIYAVLKVYEIEQGIFLHDTKEEELTEFYLDELLANSYEYDKNEILVNFKIHRADAFKDINEKYKIDLEKEIKKYLEENLPENPSYK